MEESKFGWVDTIPGSSKVVAIVPLYGYWNDVDVEELTEQVLMVSLFRLKSSKTPLNIVFVLEKQRVTEGVRNVLIGRIKGGNVVLREVEPFSSYSEYLSEGFDSAISLLESDDYRNTFIVVMNPWIIIREDGVDTLLERLNKMDAFIVSGYDLRFHEGKGIKSEEFDNFKFNPPIEIRDFDMNFWGITGTMAFELTKNEGIDTEYKTHYFISRDLWTRSRTRGFEVIQSQFIPIYSFEINWKQLESIDEFNEDKRRFLEKWGFDPGINYE
jgi:hypothetical protein